MYREMNICIDEYRYLLKIATVSKASYLFYYVINCILSTYVDELSQVSYKALVGRKNRRFLLPYT